MDTTNPWNRYSVKARVFVTARTPEEAMKLILEHIGLWDGIELDTDFDTIVYLESTIPELETTDATLPTGAAWVTQ